MLASYRVWGHVLQWNVAMGGTEHGVQAPRRDNTVVIEKRIVIRILDGWL